MFNRNLRTRFDLLNPIANKNVNNVVLKTKIRNMQENQKKYYHGKNRNTLKVNDYVMVKDYSVPGRISWKKGKIIRSFGKLLYITM